MHVPWVRFGGGSDDLLEKSIGRRNPKVHNGTKGWSHVPWVRFGGGWMIYREKVLGDETLTSTMGQKGGVMFIMESLICDSKIKLAFASPAYGTWKVYLILKKLSHSSYSN